jgi:hypothetical protein
MAADAGMLLRMEKKELVSIEPLAATPHRHENHLQFMPEKYCVSNGHNQYHNNTTPDVNGPAGIHRLP